METRRKNKDLEKKKVVIYVPNCEDADFIAAKLNKYKIKAVAVHFKAAKQSASSLIQFGAGEASVLVTAMRGNELEGNDIDCLVLGRYVDTESQFMQQLGRGLRRNTADKQLTVIDLVGNLRRRWTRLYLETTPENLLDQITLFWNVITC